METKLNMDGFTYSDNETYESYRQEPKMLISEIKRIISEEDRNKNIALVILTKAGRVTLLIFMFLLMSITILIFMFIMPIVMLLDYFSN